MEATLSNSQIEELVGERARQVDRTFALGPIHVFEDPHATGEGAVIVQISARRPADRKNWTRLRSRLSLAIRDALVERGDNRYPLIEVFEPEEWASRNG